MKINFWIILLFFNALIWGSQHPALKILSQNFSPISLNLLRFSFTTLALLPLVFYKRMRLSFKDLLVISFLSLIGNVLFGIINIYGLKLTTAGNNAVLVNSWPLMLTALSVFLFGEKVSGKSVAGLFLGLAGIVIITTKIQGIFEMFNSQYFLGNLLILLSAFCIALQVLFNKSYIKKYGSLPVAFCGVAAASLMLFLLSIITDDIKIIQKLDYQSFLLFIWLAVVTTAVTWVVWYEGIRRVGIIQASSFNMLIPVSGVIFSSIFLQEYLSLSFIAGTIIVLAGVFLVQQERK